MAQNPSYKFVKSSQDEESGDHFGGGFSILVSVVDQDDNYIITLNQSFSEHHNLIHGMEIRDSDVWILTPPKCGTTWTQETTWHIMNNMDLERTKEFLFDRSPMVDMPCISNMTIQEAKQFFKNLKDLPSPRTIKTHFPLQLLPPKLLDTCKVIFVSRNVKDACVSSYHFLKSMKTINFQDDFPTFTKMFRNGNMLHGGGPGYFSMLKSVLSRAPHPNLLVLWYEEMKKNQTKMVVSIATHIGYKISQNQVLELTDFMSFENYKKTCSLDHPLVVGKVGGQFLRKGVVGDWVNHFTDEMNKDWDPWAEKEMKNLGLDEKIVKGY